MKSLGRKLRDGSVIAEHDKVSGVVVFYRKARSPHTKLGSGFRTGSRKERNLKRFIPFMSWKTN
jgi:hypothetical protein